MRPQTVSSSQLRLGLEPIVPSRTPAEYGSFEYGFRLRIPDGPIIDRGDPLLAAYGARITSVSSERGEDEALQSEAFDPGSPVRLEVEDHDPTDPEVGVWDVDRVRRAGSLLDGISKVVSAAVECGLEQRALVIAEDRAPSDGRRDGLDLLVFHPAFVVVDTSGRDRLRRPARATRRRLILVADGTAEVRWWDPTARTGPIPAEDLPMPEELARALRELRLAYTELQAETGDEPRGFDRLEVQMDRWSLNERAAALWKRARADLGREYTVGFLGPGMERPVWSPEQLDEDEDELPF